MSPGHSHRNVCYVRSNLWNVQGTLRYDWMRAQMFFDRCARLKKCLSSNCRFENLKRKYMQFKKYLNATNDPPDWRYWNVFEEYMANRPNPTESDFMADDGMFVQLLCQKLHDFISDQLEHVTADANDDIDEMETDVNETDIDDKYSLQDGLLDNPIDVDAKFCRICLQSERVIVSENMVSLFSPLNANIRINEALAICVGLEIFQEQDSSIGNQICSDCMKQLQATYTFRKLCWASQYELTSNRNRTDVKARTINEEVATSLRVSVDAEEIEVPESPPARNSSPFESSSAFETIYEFVDTDPVPHQCISEKDAATNSTERTTTDQVVKLKNFKCSICVKKFRKLYG